jgi:hypothetical protein
MNASEIDRALSYLQSLLSQLPDTVPTSSVLYNFIAFAPDPDKVELYGAVEVAVNNALEITFAPNGRQEGSCPFTLLEKGPGLVAVVEVLRKTLTELPTSAIMIKWVEDLTKAAIHHFEEIGHPVSRPSEPGK